MGGKLERGDEEEMIGLGSRCYRIIGLAPLLTNVTDPLC